tara:strand:+ start:15778 stop:17502 length:1725 start_codon:yes stop_codon:yes gene_type:complete
MNSLKTVYNFLPKKYQLKLYFYYFTILLTNTLDVIGIGLFFPALNFLINMKTGLLFVDNFINSLNISHNQTIIFILFTIAIIFLIKNLLLVYISIFQTRFNSELGYDLSRDLFNQYLSMPIRFHSSLNSSKLLRNTSDEIFIFVKFISNSILLIFSDLTLLFIFSILLICLSSIKTMSILILFSLVAVLIYYLSKDKIKSYGNKRLVIAENVLRFLREGFSSIREVKIYNIKNYFVKKYREEGQKTVPLSIFINLMAALPKVIFEMFAVMLFILLVIYSVSIDQDFNQLIPALSILVLSIYRIAPSVTRILQNFQRLKHYMPSFYVLKSAFENNKKKIKIESENINLDFKFGNIELKNIEFYYKKNEYVLKNTNFKIEKKSRILIQGKSGCGKSTFLDILCGLLPPENGEIYINNIKANDLDKKKLLSKVSYVSQIPFLLDNDLVANIALGMDRNYDLKKIIKILKIVELEDFIKDINDKSFSRIGERGSLISGGQKQRIAIARALYFDPQILILDEATNSIDYETEIKILNNIINEYPDLTLIKVSHSKHDYLNLFEKYILKDKNLLNAKHDN